MQAVIIALLFIYSVCITVLFIKSNSDKKKVEEKLKEALQKPEGKAFEVPAAPAPVAAAPVPTPAAPAVAPAGLDYAYAFEGVRPVASPAAAPASRPAPVKKEKKSGTTAVGVSFSVGVLLMVIAAAVFISATWQTLAAGVKCLVLLAVIAAVYGLCFFCKKKLKLEKTSSVLYMLGTLITPLAIMVAFLAFSISETYIMLVCCALSLGALGYIGYRIFGSKLQVTVSYLGFCWSLIFICMESLGTLEGLGFGICAAAFVTGLIYFLAPKLRFFNIFAEVSAYVAVIGLFVCYAIPAENMWIALAGQLLYFVTLILLTRKRPVVRFFSALVPLFTLMSLSPEYKIGRTEFAIAAMAFTVVLFALYKILKHDNPASNAIISAGIYIAALLVSYNGNGGLKTDLLHYVTLILPVVSSIFIIVTSRNKYERNVYWYFLFLVLLILKIDLIEGMVPVFIFLALALISIVICKYTVQIHLATAASGAAVSSLIIGITEVKDQDLMVLIYTIITLAFYAAVVFLKPLKSGKRSVAIAVRYCSLGLLCISDLLLLVAAFETETPYFFAILVADIIFTAILIFDEDNFIGIVPAFTLFFALVREFDEIGLDSMLSGILIMIPFVLAGRFLICEKVISNKRIDWLTIFAGFACFVPITFAYKVTFLMTIYILTFIGRFGGEEEDLKGKLTHGLRTILSAALGMLAFSFVVVDGEYSDTMDLEIRMLFMLAAALIIYLVIKPGKAAKWIWFSTVAACIELEAFHALEEGVLLPLTLVSVCAVGIFIYSFIAKKRSWFILSIVTIFEFGVMLAITFWDSKLWWIYLLALGAILIVTASVNENKRRKAIESGASDKKIMLFENWTW